MGIPRDTWSANSIPFVARLLQSLVIASLTAWTVIFTLELVEGSRQFVLEGHFKGLAIALRRCLRDLSKAP